MGFAIVVQKKGYACVWIALCAITLSGCATTIHNEPINLPLMAPIPEVAGAGRRTATNGEDVLVGLTISGGGMRAAAFAFGVLSEFDHTQVRSSKTAGSLLEHIDFLSGVSGGAVTAAYFGLKGRDALMDFRERFLMRNAEESLAVGFTPTNVYRAYQGGVNDAQHFPRWLDDNLFHGATFNDLGPQRRSRIWINASDIYNRTSFVFSDATFGAICSDLGSYPIASAVAASAAMPVVFAPVVLQTYPDRCQSKIPAWVERAQHNPATPPLLKESAAAITSYRDGSVPYIKLLDGGLVDNYGLSGFTIARLSADTPYAPLSAQQAMKIRRVLFLVIDGGRGPAGDWARTAEGPTGPEIVMAAADTAIEFERTVELHGLRPHHVGVAGDAGALALRAVGGGPHPPRESGDADCGDLKFFVGRVNFEDLGHQRASELSAVPTRLKLAPADVDMVVTAGRDALRANPTFRAFLANP